MAMPQQEAALSQLAAVPGVVGSMVFDGAGAVTLSAFPPVFDPEALAQLSQRLTADGYFREWVTGEAGAMQLQFADGVVVVRSMAGSWLLVLCTPQVNPQLLSMSLTQALRRLRLPPGARTGEHRLPEAAPAAPPRERLRAIVERELGAHASQALEILSSAGPGEKGLSQAIADVEKLTRLFISKKAAEELGRQLRSALGS